MAGIGPEHMAGIKTRTIILPTVGVSDATTTQFIFHNNIGRTVSVVAVKMIVAVAYTGADTNYRSVEVVNWGTAGAGSTEIGNWDGASGADIVKGVAQAIVSTASDVTNGSTLVATFTEVGTGLGLITPYFLIEYL